MGSRHRSRADRERRLVRLLIGGAMVVLGVAVASLGIVHLVGGASPEPVRVVQTQPLTQDGRIVAVTDTSVTAVGPDGVAQTYVVTPETTSLTPQGGQGGAANQAFAVNDEVLIVGEFRNGTAIATAVAARGVSDMNGPPMDSALP
jgi:hypothetical protein